MAKAREEHILNKKILNSSKDSLKSFNRLCRQAFSCQADAQKSFDAWQKEQEFSEVFDMKIVEKKQRQKRGRPASSKLILLPRPAPLRTERATFTALRSSLTKATL